MVYLSSRPWRCKGKRRLSLRLLLIYTINSCGWPFSQPIHFTRRKKTPQCSIFDISETKNFLTPQRKSDVALLVVHVVAQLQLTGLTRHKINSMSTPFASVLRGFTCMLQKTRFFWRTSTAMLSFSVSFDLSLNTLRDKRHVLPDNLDKRSRFEESGAEGGTIFLWILKN